MSDTYKAVFVCEELGEREVWYVSSRLEAKKMLRRHTCTKNATLRKQYRGVKFTMTVRPMFKGNGDVGYDASIMGWGGL